MTVDSITIDRDRALKDRYRAVWASGDYPAVAAEIVPALGPVLVEACGVGPGDTVLDIAAGTGNAAIAAALAGGRPEDSWDASSRRWGRTRRRRRRVRSPRIAGVTSRTCGRSSATA
jgi:hypothetical protein